MNSIPDARDPRTFDYHKAITRKERSSRYIRTALDYLEKVQGREARNSFLDDMGIAVESSIFKHINDDENWNSYELEVFLYDHLKNKFADPYQAIWNVGVASGSGQLDQKDTLFTFKIKIAPTLLLLKKLGEQTKRVSLISETFGQPVEKSLNPKGKIVAEVRFNYTRLPASFKYPHWTSILASYGVVYGVISGRKGLECDLRITHWPNLPSDLPSFNGKKYILEKGTKNVLDAESGKFVACAKNGPCSIDGVVFNNGVAAIARLEWRRESLYSRIARSTWQRSRIKRDEARIELQDKITNELTIEHQKQLARYESELSEKARIIQDKMNEIQALKIQQDGDYFLTSLLTNPLIANRNTSEIVTTEFLIDQKKKFEFKNRRSQIGGDICVTDNVVLQNRNYVAFLNGDAMGKSMQGAGGALVLGVVYNTYLARTRYSVHQQRKSPEAWVKDAYLDLQNIFISFNGSMYISVAMGLVDEANGMVYYVNAEHPLSVLYRGGRAAFIESEPMLRKIGTPGDENNIRIFTFQLQPGDIMIMGSDGRDDLELMSRGKERAINVDENEFLRRTEEGAGLLAQIRDRLGQSGSLTDDLSLLRVAYHEGEQERSPGPREVEVGLRLAKAALAAGSFAEGTALLENLIGSFPRRIEILKYLGMFRFKMKNFSGALESLSAYFSFCPADNEVLYLIASACKRTGDYQSAVDCGEKLFLRSPALIKNLLNLADAYRLLGNRTRAEYFIQKSKELDPENVYGQKILSLLSPVESVHGEGV